ncbi:hypothetical protein Y032_0223g2655 [Ancylostoma ceylanicum]|uniref:Uncharacterized protein n=1 Tax=Ancylostoma ceylanicum TaxID=53326 RepID=A0A016SIF6_9BILA|nr:hypothetical protein Y032_0223g2655 [Ancylostoma ceylanicum]
MHGRLSRDGYVHIYVHLHTKQPAIILSISPIFSAVALPHFFIAEFSATESAIAAVASSMTSSCLCVSM